MKYTLHYFDLPARGEPIRILFHHQEIEFEDKRYTFDDMPTIKSNELTFPLGQLPTLEANDQVINQSHAILRYLANVFNLYGSTNKEKAIIDVVLDSLKEIEEKLIGAYFFKPTVEEKVQQIKTLMDNYAPRVFRMIEKYIKANNDGASFLVGNEITVGDIILLVAIETIQLDHNIDEYKNFLDKYPLIKSLNERVRDSKNIKAYLDNRGSPKYPFPKKE